jgi:hypothetical protein
VLHSSIQELNGPEWVFRAYSKFWLRLDPVIYCCAVNNKKGQLAEIVAANDFRQ